MCRTWPHARRFVLFLGGGDQPSEDDGWDGRSKSERGVSLAKIAWPMACQVGVAFGLSGNDTEEKEEGKRSILESKSQTREDDVR